MISALPQAIGDGLRKVRKQKALTQRALGDLLAISQGQLSLIELGKGSLSAEQLIALILKFNLSLDDFLPVARLNRWEAELQNALAHFGARQIVSIPDVPVSSKYQDVDQVILDVLISGVSERYILALAPVVIRQIRLVILKSLFKRFQELSLENRLLWFWDCLHAALSKRLGDSGLSASEIEIYKRAKLLVDVEQVSFLNKFFRRGKNAFDEDFLIRGTPLIAAGRLRKESDRFAKKWRVLTDIKAEDFYQSLVEADTND